MKKLFCELKMGWPGVIIFAAVAGIVTGALASIPATDETSFRDIAISFEWWVIFAFIIASNCEKAWESMLKIFVFFLISQPLVYVTEVVAGHLDAQMALYYYKSIWGPITLLTLPGGLIAFLIKKQNALGCIILGLGCTIQAFMGVSYTIKMFNNPPYHLISAIVCFASIFVMIYCIQDTWKRRIATLLIAVVVTAALIILMLCTGRSLTY